MDLKKSRIALNCSTENHKQRHPALGSFVAVDRRVRLFFARMVSIKKDKEIIFIRKGAHHKSR